MADWELWLAAAASILLAQEDIQIQKQSMAFTEYVLLLHYCKVEKSYQPPL